MSQWWERYIQTVAYRPQLVRYQSLLAGLAQQIFNKGLGRGPCGRL